MCSEEQHIRHIMLFEYRKGNSAAVATKNISEVHENVLAERTCRRWFAKFRSADYSLKNLPRGRPLIVVDNKELEALVESDPRQTLHEMAATIKCSHETIRQHLQQIGKVLKEGVWVPHKLSDQNRVQRATIAASLLARNTTQPFLDRIVTGDEKWVLNANIKKKRQWLSSGRTPGPTPKPGLHPKKIMLCIWCDIRGVVHWELLDPKVRINSEIYCQQLTRLNETLVNNRPALVNRKGVILQHDNAKPHVSIETQQKIRELGWEVLPHPPYSPDIAPSDYHLFGSLSHHLSGKEFENEEAVKQDISGFIASKSTEFLSAGSKCWSTDGGK